jgi:predicted RNA binding protein YcfA (HicA-like mRNA interferase family)
MPKTPSYTPREIIDVLKKYGFELDRTKGSYQIFINSETH